MKTVNNKFVCVCGEKKLFHFYLICNASVSSHDNYCDNKLNSQFTICLNNINLPVTS